MTCIQQELMLHTLIFQPFRLSFLSLFRLLEIFDVGLDLDIFISDKEKREGAR